MIFIARVFWSVGYSSIGDDKRLVEAPTEGKPPPSFCRVPAVKEKCINA
jgi:hypothetical protein